MLQGSLDPGLGLYGARHNASAASAAITLSCALCYRQTGARANPRAARGVPTSGFTERWVGGRGSRASDAASTLGIKPLVALRADQHHISMASALPGPLHRRQQPPPRG